MEKVNYILKILNGSFVLELMDDAEKMLAKQLLFRQDETLPAIDLHSWQDNPKNRQTGHYFAKETEKDQTLEKFEYYDWEITRLRSGSDERTSHPVSPRVF